MKIEVNRNAKAYAQEEITINAPAGKIYTILADINKWPVWQPNIKSAHIDGDPAEGSEFQWNAGGLKIISKLHTVKPFSEIGWTGRMWWITAVHNWTINEQNGKCLVTVEESLEGLLARSMNKSLKNGMLRSLEDLKAASEKNV